MAIVDGDPTGGTTVQTGIPLRITVAVGYRGVIERSTAGSGGPFTAIVELPPSDGSAQDYLDILPVDTATRWYRAIARRSGYTDSTASPVVSAVPRQIL